MEKTEYAISDLKSAKIGITELTLAGSIPFWKQKRKESEKKKQKSQIIQTESSLRFFDCTLYRSLQHKARTASRMYPNHLNIYAEGTIKNFNTNITVLISCWLHLPNQDLISKIWVGYFQMILHSSSYRPLFRKKIAQIFNSLIIDCFKLVKKFWVYTSRFWNQSI
jgi:hypothetical protein